MIQLFLRTSLTLTIIGAIFWAVIIIVHGILFVFPLVSAVTVGTLLVIAATAWRRKDDRH